MKKLISATVQTFLHKASRKKFERDDARAKKSAYAKVGEIIKNRKTKGRRVDGHKLYEYYYQKNLKKALDAKGDRDFFISKLS